MTTVVLGWDALDYELLGEYGLRDAFGQETRRIGTFDNPILCEPHTYEVWPSIITGVKPGVHGIRAAREDGGVNWDSDLLNTAARVADGVVPDRVRTVIGRYLRNNGAAVEMYGRDYYRDNDVSTVFEDRRSLSIAVPNHITDRDRELSTNFDRRAQMADVLERRKVDGDTGILEATVKQPKLEQRLVGAARQKLGMVEAAIEREYDLVFCWFGYLDTVGHLDPMLDDPLQERAYQQAARWTAELRDALPPSDSLVSVSDHGLRDGDHTHDATLAGPPAVVDAAESVLDVRAALETVTMRRENSGMGSLRDAYQPGTAGIERSADEVHDHLKQLGYL